MKDAFETSISGLNYKDLNKDSRTVGTWKIGFIFLFKRHKALQLPLPSEGGVDTLIYNLSSRHF